MEEHNPRFLGVETSKHGIIWRVGNGQQINIWSDPWLPREITRRPITPKGRNLLTTVEEFIDPITGQWDAQLLNQIFWRRIFRSLEQYQCTLKWNMWSAGTMTVKDISL